MVATSVLTDPVWLDRMYNNRALVPDHAAHFSRWSTRSAQARSDLACELDVPFGPTPAETLDVFPAQGVTGPAPVLLFIHGGYWRSLDKRDHSFVAPAFTRRGACVVVPNYALCPAVSIRDITLQMVAAVAWTWRHIARHGGDPSRIVVAGHSAGGQLAAMMLACRWPQVDADLPTGVVRKALSVSGVFDLRPLVHTPFLKGDLRLTDASAREVSPALMPAPASGRLVTVAGGAESAEFLRQNRLIRDAWGPRAVPVCEDLPGLNHFSVLEDLSEPGTRLNRLALDLLGL
ncbi:MAG: alpha/beta hydrolase [Ramlibacter sp.]|jgi:arylformamidase|nr:alpha/beta hydrolase [Ramlibacter sp.]